MTKTDLIDLKPNDIDVYEGSSSGGFALLPGGNKYVEDGRLPHKINFVRLTGGLTLDNIISNNDIDINATSVAILVTSE